MISREISGANIKKIRNTLHLSQNKFGNKIGVSAVTIWRWEKDKSKPLGESIQMLALLRLTANDILKKQTSMN